MHLETSSKIISVFSFQIDSFFCFCFFSSAEWFISMPRGNKSFWAKTTYLLPTHCNIIHHSGFCRWNTTHQGLCSPYKSQKMMFIPNCFLLIPKTFLCISRNEDTKHLGWDATRQTYVYRFLNIIRACCAWLLKF